MPYTIKINGADHAVDVDGDTPLLWVLRDVLGMTGTKFGCGMALCGACTVHLDGSRCAPASPRRSVGAAAITTIEAIGDDAGRARRSSRPGSTSRSSSAATASPARSCRRRRCWPATRNPSDADIDAAMSGNICRCGTYVRIRAAIKQAAQAGNGTTGRLNMPLDRISRTTGGCRALAAGPSCRRRPRRRRRLMLSVGLSRRLTAARAACRSRRRRLRAQRLHPHRSRGKVTLIMPKVEMGQGTYTVHADADRRGAGGGARPGAARARAAQRKALWQPALGGSRRPAARPRCAPSGSRCARPARPRARMLVVGGGPALEGRSGVLPRRQAAR